MTRHTAIRAAVEHQLECMPGEQIRGWFGNGASAQARQAWIEERNIELGLTVPPPAMS